MKRTMLILCIFFSASPLIAKETIIFTGIPEIKIIEDNISRAPENLTKEKSIEYKCTITKIDDKYYWSTRENLQLLPVSSGFYTTFWAINGAGYVRIVKPDMRESVKKTAAMIGDPQGKFDYVEHLLLGLKSVTYYGQSK